MLPLMIPTFNSIVDHHQAHKPSLDRGPQDFQFYSRSSNGSIGSGLYDFFIKNFQFYSRSSGVSGLAASGLLVSALSIL